MRKKSFNNDILLQRWCWELFHFIILQSRPNKDGNNERCGGTKKEREESQVLSLACIIREERNMTGVNLPAFLHLAILGRWYELPIKLTVDEFLLYVSSFLADASGVLMRFHCQISCTCTGGSLAIKGTSLRSLLVYFTLRVLQGLVASGKKSRASI
jgi:hypothetical protein